MGARQANNLRGGRANKSRQGADVDGNGKEGNGALKKRANVVQFFHMQTVLMILVRSPHGHSVMRAAMSTAHHAMKPHASGAAPAEMSQSPSASTAAMLPVIANMTVKTAVRSMPYLRTRDLSWGAC